MSVICTSFIPTGNGSATRARDQLSFPFTAIPQAMTAYLQFMESGASLQPSAPRIFMVAASPLAAPDFTLSYTGASGYRATVATTYGQANAIAGAKPAIGQLVELRITVSAAGVLQLGQSIGGNAEVLTATQTINLPQAWSALTLHLGGTGSEHAGAIALRILLLMRGVQSLATMQRVAGTLVR